jgi:hypothetical protein
VMFQGLLWNPQTIYFPIRNSRNPKPWIGGLPCSPISFLSLASFHSKPFFLFLKFFLFSNFFFALWKL